jgi:hypothetical protein
MFGKTCVPTVWLFAVFSLVCVEYVLHFSSNAELAILVPACG